MNPIAVVLLMVTGLAGVYLFLATGGEQRAAHDQARAQHQLDKERFDQDFEVIFNGGAPADMGRAARIEALEKDLAERQAKRRAAEEEARKAEEELKAGIQGLTHTEKQK